MEERLEAITKVILDVAKHRIAMDLLFGSHAVFDRESRNAERAYILEKLTDYIINCILESMIYSWLKN